jgi:hypothetical protein
MQLLPRASGTTGRGHVRKSPRVLCFRLPCDAPVALQFTELPPGVPEPPILEHIERWKQAFQIHLSVWLVRLSPI